MNNDFTPTDTPTAPVPLISGSIHFVPIVHRRVTFAEQVRRIALEWRPEVIAVELPRTLRAQIEGGVSRLPEVTAVCYPEATRPGVMAYLPVDPCDGLIEAVRLGMEHGIAVEFIDLDLPAMQERHRYVPDDTLIDKVGLERYVERIAPLVEDESEDPRRAARDRNMASRLRALQAEGLRVMCVLGMSHYQSVRGLVEAESLAAPAADAGGVESINERPDARLAYIDAESLTEVLGEIPYLAWLFQQHRAQLELTGEIVFDKLAAIHEILSRARDRYYHNYRETISMTHWRALMQYARNLAMTTGRLRPDFYELVVAARGTVDGDYGWEVYELAGSYPPQRSEATDLPRLKIRGVRGRLEGDEHQYRMQPRYEEPPTEQLQLGLRRRPPLRLREIWQRRWANEFSGMGICSWPPEDEVQERFMDMIRKRALQRVTEDRRQVQEFSTTLLDGLDVRETMRNWHSGKLYVQQTPMPKGRVGSVVLLFEDEPIEAIDSWRTTLYAEHRNESDISFFATPLGEHVVGPRIARTEFGGILSVWPAWGIPDIWSYKVGEQVRSAGEALLAAGILFSPERYVAWVADVPPPAYLREMADHNRKEIVYLPLTMFSRRALRKIRRFHILDGHDVRAWAHDYIFDE